MFRVGFNCIASLLRYQSMGCQGLLCVVHSLCWHSSSLIFGTVHDDHTSGHDDNAARRWPHTPQAQPRHCAAPCSLLRDTADRLVVAYERAVRDTVCNVCVCTCPCYNRGLQLAHGTRLPHYARPP